MSGALPPANPPSAKSLRETKEERTQRAYLEQPDSEIEAGDWFLRRGMGSSVTPLAPPVKGTCRDRAKTTPDAPATNKPTTSHPSDMMPIRIVHADDAHRPANRPHSNAT
jgi:hypothetical protein